MDVAYDRIQEETLPQDPKKAENSAGKDEASSTDPAKPTLNTEFQEAYRSISTTPWGAKLGGFFSTVQKQGSTLYDGARQEATTASGEALKGFQDLRASLASRARSLSSGEKPSTDIKEGETPETDAKENKARTESEAMKEGEGMVSRFRAEAAKRLKDLEKAEEAADAAILRFGSNLGNFLKEAVTVAPPSQEVGKDGKSKILFESRTEDGKRVIHSTRLEAQLHAIHTSADKFLKDPDMGEEKKGEWEDWKEGFDVEGKTEDVKKDLERFEELRKMMERVVPENVVYGVFWCRYYFLRNLVEKEEQRRREVLKGAAQSQDDDIAWDDDSDDDQSTTPQNPSQKPPPSKPAPGNASPASLATIQPSDNNATLKPEESRRSQDEKSQPDSDASYDLVSGATSKTPGSPKAKGDDEEEDWE